MPWKFIRDLWFHEVLQTTIVGQIKKENEEIVKPEKYSQKPLELYTNLYVCLWVWMSLLCGLYLHIIVRGRISGV